MNDKTGELVLTEAPTGGCSFCLAVSRDLSGTDPTADDRASSGGAVLRRPTPPARLETSSA